MDGARPQRYALIAARIAAALFALLSSGAVLTITEPVAVAQVPDVTLASFPRGQVTEVGRDYVSIDSKRYDLRPDVIIQDERTQPKQLKDVEVGGTVAYHIKYGRIDQLVLVLPR